MRQWLLAAVVAAVVGCGGEDVAPAKLEVTVSSNRVTAGGAAVTVTATGGEGSVSWSIEPASGAGALSADEGESTSFLPAAAVEAATTVAVTATAGGQSAFALITVEPSPPRTVQGRVGSTFGGPVRNVMVALLPSGDRVHALTTRTDSEGRFTFEDVPERYDLAVYNSTVPWAEVTVYQGLTRLDPWLEAPNRDWHSASLSGQIIGGGFPSAPPPGSTTRVYAAIGNTSAQVPAASDGTYAFEGGRLHWTGPAGTSAVLHALQVTDTATGHVTAWHGYGKLEDVSVAAGGTVTGREIPLSPVTTTTLNGALTLPDGYTSEALYGALQLGQVTATIHVGTAPSSAFGVVTPSFDGARIYVVATANGPDGARSAARMAGLRPDASGVQLTFQAAQDLQSPAADATAVAPGSRFSWTGPDGLHTLSLFDGTASVAVRIITTDHEATLPELASLGRALAPATPYAWSVSSVHLSGLSSIDDATGPGGEAGLAAQLFLSPVPVASHRTETGLRTFTTAP